MAPKYGSGDKVIDDDGRSHTIVKSFTTYITLLNDKPGVSTTIAESDIACSDDGPFEKGQIVFLKTTSSSGVNFREIMILSSLHAGQHLVYDYLNEESRYAFADVLRTHNLKAPENDYDRGYAAGIDWATEQVENS